MSSNRTVRLDFSGVKYHCLDALVFSCLGSFTVTLLGAVAEHWVVFMVLFRLSQSNYRIGTIVQRLGNFQ